MVTKTHAESDVVRSVLPDGRTPSTSIAGTLLAPLTGAGTGAWIPTRGIAKTFQGTIYGTGTVTATITIQGSNGDPQGSDTPANFVPFQTALATLTLNAASPASDASTVNNACRYVRAVVSSPTGTISAIYCTIGD